MAPNVLTDKSTLLPKSTCFTSTTSCSTFRPTSSSSSSVPSPSPNPRTCSVSSSPHQPSERLSGTSVTYATAYPTPVDPYPPTINQNHSFTLIVPASLSLPSGSHRPKSLPPGRSLRISAGAGLKLHHQAGRHVSNGSCEVSSSAPDSSTTPLSCHNRTSPTLPRQFLVGKVVVSPPQRNPPPPVASSAASVTLTAGSACAPVAAHATVGAAIGSSLHPPVVILHSKPYGLFGPLPKSLLRDGHKQRIAGVDVLRLSDSTIIPRIENSSLQQMLQADPSIFPTLEAALTECVTFLYNEGIKPFAGEIAHQMRKRIEGGSWLPSEVVALAVAAKDVYPRVERRVKGEDGWVVLLKKELQPPDFDGFVDTRAREDCYSPEQWREFNRYFIEKMRMRASEGGGSATSGAVAQFTEGRYALAERLRAEIPMFQSMKLAHLIRMVQLASWKKLLTYRDKALVPIAACPVTAKEFAQRNCMNMRGSDKSAAALASIEQLLRALSCIVDPEPTGIFLAQLKDLVRWTTYERLDCMVLGHTKLQDLLMSEPFIRFYRLYTPEGNEHCTYVQSKKFPLPWGAVLHTKCSMLWNPDACPMDPSSEQQHFSLSDAGCCWQYKALVPLYAQQRTSARESTYSSTEAKGGERPNSTAAMTSNENESLPSLLHCIGKTHGSRCDEGSLCHRSPPSIDTKAAMRVNPRITDGNAFAAGGAVATTVVDEATFEDMDGRKGAHNLFHWVERDILKLLDEDNYRTSSLSEAEPTLHSVRNDGGPVRDAVPEDHQKSTLSPCSVQALKRGQNPLPATCRKKVLTDTTHVLMHTSQQSCNSLIAGPSSGPWYPIAFLEACCANSESATNSPKNESSAAGTLSASAALLHMTVASHSLPCCCNALHQDEVQPAKQLALEKHKGYSLPTVASSNLGGEETFFSSPCAQAAAASVPAVPASTSCWHESTFKMQRFLRQSPRMDAATCFGKGCYLSASCISSSPYKRDEENMRTPSTSSDGVLHLSPPALRAGAGTGLASSAELGIKDVQTRCLSHAEKTRETN